jgi:hypothetical protein
VRHWGRARIPPAGTAFVPAFVWPDISRALTSLPLSDRLSDAFHRRFLQEFAPQLVPNPTPSPRAHVPAVVRRLARRARSTQARLRPRPSGLGRIVATAPDLYRWAGESLAREDVRQAIGAAWVARLKRGYERQAGQATQQVLLMASATALADALTQHSSTRSPAP